MAEFIPRADFHLLYSALTEAGYRVIGPVERDGAIVFSQLGGFDELPLGVREQASNGRYRLEHTGGKRCFGWNTGPQGLKPWLFRPEQQLWRAEPTEDGLRFRESIPEATPLAVIGIRACDLAALKIQDQHFLHGAYRDPYYGAQREQLLLVAVNCARSADTCFCVSTGDGPEVTSGYDLLLDELDEGYLIRAGSERGSAILAALTLASASNEQLVAAKAQVDDAGKQQKQMPSEAQLMTLLASLESSRWQDIAERCLACGNCTLVCPTCFCSRQDAEPSLNGEAGQVRRWDSCFSEQHSYAAGRVYRPQISQRYRQWLLHKLVTWQQQFGRSGCVGCGRCIAWCPVGIDLVDEAQALLGEVRDE